MKILYFLTAAYLMVSSYLVGQASMVLDTGRFTDSRDKISYRCTHIGSQVWMAENLKFNSPKECYYYENATFNGTKYGMLYNWKTAQEVCPAGWHLPSDNEWEMLAQNISLAKGPFLKDSVNWDEVGRVLKAPSGWPSGCNGTDDFAFSVLPAGYRFSAGTYYSLHFSGYFWTASQTEDGDGVFRYVNHSSNRLYRDTEMKIRAYSVRCVKNVGN
jgi:uncharacterized protein (TIGR02145 family)